jgi:hypothetical protein
VGGDLVFGELPITLGGASRNVLGRLPLIDPRSNEIGHRGLGPLDVAASVEIGDQLGLLDLGFLLGTLETVPFAFALSRVRVAHVDHDGPVAGRPLADVPLHLDFSSGRLRFDLSNMTLASSRPRLLGRSSMTLVTYSVVTGNPEVPAIIRSAAVRTASAFS